MSSDSFPKSNPFATESSSPQRVDRLSLGKSVLGDGGVSVVKKVFGHQKATRRASMSMEDLSMSPEEMRLTEIAWAAAAEGETVQNFEKLQFARECLGAENVHGVRDVERALGFPIDRSKVPPILYTEADFKKSQELREQGVHEMLVLFVGEDHEGVPLTFQRMDEIFSERYGEMELGPFLNPRARGNYNRLRSDRLIFTWKLVTKECIPGSYGKRHSCRAGDPWTYRDTQDFVIEKFSQRNVISPLLLHRPDPIPMLYMMAIHLLTTERVRPGHGEWLLSEKAHWSASSLTDEEFITINAMDHLGAFMEQGPRGTGSQYVGVCLSRDPSSAL